MSLHRFLWIGALAVASVNIALADDPQPTGQTHRCTNHMATKQALFGDLHVHTELSFDAVAGRLSLGPEDAYRYAKGEAIRFFPLSDDGETTGSIQISRPLDFAAVTDHSEFLGERELCRNPLSPAYNGAFCVDYRAREFRGTLMMATVISREEPTRIKELCGDDGALCREWAQGPWERIQTAAKAANDESDRCEFTSLVGYEYTGTPSNSNYHRNVIFRSENVPALPTTFLEAPSDYELWTTLDRDCNKESGCDYLTIPHNSNMSNGRLLTPYADLQRTDENKIAYAKKRQEREPLMEIYQHKGQSECFNGIGRIVGAVDELCEQSQVKQLGDVSNARSFELVDGQLEFQQPDTRPVQECADGERSGGLGMFAGGCISGNDFLRGALLSGLEENQATGFNPVKLGVIASTDGHTATPGNVDEADWEGTVSGETTPQERLQAGTLPSGIKGNPGGLVGVWATENTRDAIFDALKRRETFGTSGPRIQPRFFAGYGYNDGLCNTPAMIEKGYAGGVPMGGDLPAPAGNQKPRFVVSALRDPHPEEGAPLQKLQLIKGWIDAKGNRHVTVTTVAGNEKSDAKVDLKTGQRIGTGFSTLCAVYQDDEFDPELPAFYYLRVVENPSPRWSFFDCNRLDQSERPAICGDMKQHIINEMAWTSPVWYAP